MLGVALGLSLGAHLATAAAAQDVGGTDWTAKVKSAIENPRYAVQRAASNEIGRGGDAAVPAVRAYADEHGKDALPMLLVDAIAQARAGSEATTALLRAWAVDRTFNWRAQALTGLALRESAADAELFHAALADASHLFRVAGAKGVYALSKRGEQGWDDARAVLDDPDPRARVMFALFLWERRELSARATLVRAVADDRAFLDDDWGRRYAVQAVRALAGPAQTDFGYKATESLAGNRDAIAKMAKWAEIEVPLLREREAIEDLGGVEFRSCRHGDLFVRWSADQVDFDLDRGRRAALDAQALASLTTALESAAKVHTSPREVLGKVVCDYVQITVRQPARVWKVAPGALSAELASVLDALRQVLRTNQAAALAQEIDARLPQFAERR